MKRPVLAVGLGAVALLVHGLALGDWMLDDAFIFFRYAENWARGWGPVFNQGERVEGYTSIVWLLLLTATTRGGVDPIVAARGLGALCAVGTLVLIALVHRRGVFTSSAGAHAALLLGTCGAFTVWPASGMETSLAGLLTTLTIMQGLALERGASWREAMALGILATLMALNRPEAVAIAALVLAGACRRAPRRGWAAVAIFVVILAGYVGWRWSYYGWPLPNTFYAKVGGTLDEWRRGGEYVLRFMRMMSPLLAIAALAAWRRHNDFAPRALIFAVIVVQMFFTVAAGGDPMPAFRLLAPVVPAIALLAGDAITRLAPTRIAIALTLACAGFGVAAMRFDPDVHGRIRADRVVRAGRITGTWMRQSLPPDALLATNTAGSVPYYSGLRCVDMLGLTDARIAHRRLPGHGRGWTGHEKYDGAYVLSRQPDYVQFASALGSAGPAFPSDHDLWNQPGFRDRYELRTYDLQLARGAVALHLYRRRDASGP